MHDRTSNSSPARNVPQDVQKAKADAERAAWRARYDAAQPNGRTLSVNDYEYLELKRVFRLVSYHLMLIFDPLGGYRVNY